MRGILQTVHVKKSCVCCGLTIENFKQNGVAIKRKRGHLSEKSAAFIGVAIKH